MQTAEIFRICPAIVYEQFDDETIVVNLETGSYYSVQGVADAIWSCVVAGLSRSAIAQRIASEYAGDREQIVAQTSAFLDRLGAEALMVPEIAAGGETPVSSYGDAAGGAKAFAPPTLQKYSDMEEMLRLDPIHEVDAMGWPQTKAKT